MNLPERKSFEDTRARILEVAWLLFRELGARATIADVATRLGMSSANVYRFFPSKQALCEAVAANQLGALLAAVREIASADAPASERLRAVLMTLYQAMRDQMVNEARVHEIVEVAINEHWAPIREYETTIVEVITGLVTVGQTSGEFGPGDPKALAGLTLCACAGVHHPQMIALYDQKPESLATPDEIVGFALRALSNREGSSRS